MVAINKKPFKVKERSGKGGKVTILINSISGSMTLEVSGKVTAPQGLQDTLFFYSSINSISKDFQHTYPDLFDQGSNKAIVTYTFPTSIGTRDSAFWYEFQYILKGGSDIKTAFTIVLSQIENLNDRIISCMKEALEECDDPADLQEIPQ